MSGKIVKLPGRPPKEGFDYFSLYCDFFENDKIKALRRALGEVGILTYLNILCRIYRTHGYYYTCTDLDALSQDIAEQIANDRIRRKIACVRETINYLISHEILDRDLAERGIISGIAMQEKYIEMVCRARRKINMDVHVLVDVRLVISKIRDNAEEIPIITEENTVNAEEMQQSKEKEKVKDTLSLSIAHARGKHGNVMLSDEELADLTAKGIPMEYIDHFSEKLKANHYTYENHHQAILDWWKGDKKKWTSRAAKKETASERESPSFDTDGFFDAALRRSYGEALGDHEEKQEGST